MGTETGINCMNKGIGERLLRILGLHEGGKRAIAVLNVSQT